MNILIVGHTYIAPINQEKWKTVAHLYPDAKITIVIPDSWPDVLFSFAGKAESPYKNCSFIPLPAFGVGNEVRYGYYPRRLIALLRSVKPDIIYVEQGDNAFSFFEVICLAKIFCRSARLFFFTWVNWKPIWSLKYKVLWRWIERFNLYNADGAVVGNHDGKKCLEDKGFTKPILVLPQLGVKLERLQNKHKTSTNSILFIGRIVDEKGVFILLEAFTSLQKLFPDWKLIYVGRGPALKKLEQTVQQLPNVSCLGAVPHEEIFTLLSTATIFVLPSYDTPLWREQFGHVIIESMACGIPVIGSQGGEIPHVIGDAGLVAQAQDAQSLATCLKTFMENQTLRNEYAIKGYERIKNCFTHEVIGKKTYEFLTRP